MATVIDQLVVKLSLDDVEFQKGEKRVAAGLTDTKKKTENVGKNIAADGKKGAEFFGQLEKAALKFFAVLTVGRGLSDFTRTIIGTGAQLDRVAGRLGTSSDRLSRWQGAVRQSGGTAEAFMGTMQGLSSSLTELKLTGNTGILPYLQALGVSVADANGKAKPLEAILGDIGDKLNALPNKADAFNIGQNLGIDEGTINLLLKGRSEVERLLAAQKGYSDADAKAAREAQEKWEGVKLEIERTSQAIVIKALPIIERLTTAMLKFSETAVPVLLQVGDVIGDLDDKTDGWSTALIGVLATLRLIGGSGVLGGITRLGGALGGVIAAALLLKGDESDSSKQAKALEVQAVGGDREAAVRLARTQLGNQWWRTMFGGKITESDVKDMADQIQSRGRSDQANYGSRAERNNNPGNLNYAGQAGATLESGSGARFARFGSTAEGVSALAKQLQRYGDRGLDTIKKIITTYAPSSENNTQAYIDALSKRLGVSGDQKLDLKDAGTLSGLIKGIAKHESGSDYLSDSDVMTGLSMAGVKSGGAQQAPNVSIGEVKVYTQATDANGIARDMRGAIIQQANTGVR